MRKARDLLKTIRRRFVSRQKPNSQMDASERYCFSPELRWNHEVEEYFVKAYGAEHFARISESLTFPSSYSCIRVNVLKSTSDVVIEKLLAIIKGTGDENAKCALDSSKSDEVTKCNANQKQQSDLEEFSKLSLRPFEDLNSEKESLSSFPISKCQIPGLEYVVFVKGSGPHSIDYGYTHEQPPKEVIVSRKCAEAVLRGAQVYVPGIMACSAHVEKGDTVAVSVAIEQPGPDGGWGLGITRGTILQGSETDPYHLERNHMYIGQGTTMMSRAGIFRASNGIAVDMSNRVFKLPSFYDVLEGEIFLQNLPSIVTAHVLDPQKGERILDMCAAPGGKTTAIAIIMKDEGEVVATDRSHNKVVDIQNLAAELGLNCIRTYKLDALKSCQRNEANETTALSSSTDNCGSQIIQSSSSPKLDVEEVSPINVAQLNYDKISNGHASNEGDESTCASKADSRKNLRRMKNARGRNQATGGRVEKSKGFPPNSFDRVLLDAPCSALGLRPRLFTAEETVDSLRRHARYQKRMLDQAVQLVRPGGVLVYSTCTVNPGENESLVRYALDTYNFLSLAQQHPKIGGPGLVGSYEFPDGYFEEWLRPGEEELVQRFDPSSSLDTIGFFIAKFNVDSSKI